MIVHTGWGERYHDRERYLGRPAGQALPSNDTQHLHFPGVGSQAAQLLLYKSIQAPQHTLLILFVV